MMKYLLRTLCVCVVIAFAQHNAHAAEDIIIVDMQRILQEAKAAKDVRGRIKEKRDQYQTQITKEEDKLRDLEKKLADQRAILSPEAFESKSKEFNEKLRDVQLGVQEKRSKLDAALNQSLDAIQESVLEIITELSKEKNFKLALPSSQVLFATNSLNMTAEVLGRLDKKLPTIDLDID